MADNTPIEWTDASWNTIGGCSRVDEGCRNCYAEIMAARFSKPGQWGAGLAQIVTSGGKPDHRWTGDIMFNAAALTQPLRWKKPRRIFVNSTADTFHEGVPDAWIDQIFAVMALAPQHTFQVLTKRPERMQAYMAANPGIRIRTAMRQIGGPIPVIEMDWPLPNVWLGTSISDQASADLRIPHLLDTPAAIRFISAEPLLGAVDLTLDGLACLPCKNVGDGLSMDPTTGAYECCSRCDHTGIGDEWGIDWVITGGESGPGARPMHPDWARLLRDQCTAAGVPFFFKQFGEWLPLDQMKDDQSDALYHTVAPGQPDDASRRCKYESCCLTPEGAKFTMSLAGHYHHNLPRQAFTGPRDMSMYRLGKSRAGRLLDGREWNQMPGVM